MRKGGGREVGREREREHLQLATFHQSGVHINIASSRQAMSDSKSFLAHTECGASSQIYLKFKDAPCLRSENVFRKKVAGKRNTFGEKEPIN